MSFWQKCLIKGIPLHFFCFVYEIFVGENLLGFLSFLAEETSEETGFLGGSLGFGVNRVADSAVGYSTEGVDEADRFLDVVNIVERIENTHHVEAVFDSLFIKSFEYVVGVRNIAEEVTST